MKHWFQNLNDNKNKLFHFRGSMRTDSDYHSIFKYEVCSGLAFKFEYSSDEEDPMLILGILFAKLYLTSKYFKMPFLTYGLDYGFSFYEYAFHWKWGTKPMEWSSKTPKWRQFTFHFDDFFLGKYECIEYKMNSVENIKFKIGDKEFVMNSIAWIKRTRFRRHIPFALFNQPWISVEMKIDEPPMRAGKGENSWDCEDDGSFGMSMPWKHNEIPRWDNGNICSELAVKDYAESVQKDAKKYGCSSGERGIRHNDQVIYIGT